MEDTNSSRGANPLRLLRRVITPIFILLLMTASANGQQPSGISDLPKQMIGSDQMDCEYLRRALQATQERVKRLQNAAGATSSLNDSSSNGDLKPPAANLTYELKVLNHDSTEVDKCLAWNQRAQKVRSKDCASSDYFDFHVTHNDEPAHDVRVWRQSENSAFFFESTLSVDADGAPNAYRSDNLGIDDLVNAGAPGSWSGLAVDKNGNPLIQGSSDPFPGYYVSVTDLSDRSRPATDPTRYVDASQIPYIVLPEGNEIRMGAHLGDFAMVFNLENGKSSPAIFADTGPSDRIGEGSVALADDLGLWPDARSGGTTRGILYLVFPGSGNGNPRPIQEISAEAENQFKLWGGNSQLAACGIR